MITKPADAATVTPARVGGAERRAGGRTARARLSQLVLRDPVVAVAGVILLFMLLVASIGPFLVSDPNVQELSSRRKPPGFVADDGSTLVFGSDQLGRDVLSRVVNGARISLVVAVASVGLAAVAGSMVGLIAGFYRGTVDDIVMRLVDVQLSIPYIMLAMSIVALVGTSLRNVILVLLIYGWVIYVRLVRGQTLSLREHEFVLASRSVGASDIRILLRHILPNLVSPLIVISTLEMANMIVLEASLGFLGLGVPPPTATWGGMLADGREYLTAGVWWVAVVPGVAITVTILSINLLGDWLRDQLDPRGSRS